MESTADDLNPALAGSVQPLRGKSRVITSDTEATAAAREWAARLRIGAADRDFHRLPPWDLIDDYSLSGLWALTVPKEYGGLEASYATVAKVLGIIASADPSLAQIVNSTYHAVPLIGVVGDERQKASYYQLLLDGHRWGNASSELGGPKATSGSTRLSRKDGRLVLNGRKYYTTGALYSHMISVIANDDEGRLVAAVIPNGAPGLTILDDWDGFGQRLTASGTVILDDVAVEPENVLDIGTAYQRMPAIADLIHSAIDLGIARGALDDTIDYLKTKARPAPTAGVDKATQDPYAIAIVGDLTLRYHAAELMLERAGRMLDAAFADRSDENRASAACALAEAKVLTTEIALDASSKLFQICGASSTRRKYHFDRHWRNARTHTVHDPVHWKYHVVGSYWIDHVDAV